METGSGKGNFYQLITKDLDKVPEELSYVLAAQ